MNTDELFTLITCARAWYKGFCTRQMAQKYKNKHLLGKLTFEAYSKLFNHFGYTKQLNWVKKDENRTAN